MSGPRASSLYGIIPTPGTQQPEYEPPLGILGTAENFSAGMGRGIQNQLSGLLGIAKQPKQYVNALWKMGLLSPQEGSPMLRNALADMAGKAMSGPAGFGEVLGENVSMRGLLGVNALSKPGPMHEMTAYHGSPHDFDEFDSSKIGTGEGAQVYGHGLYFAESPDVAESYRLVLGKRDFGDLDEVAQEASWFTEAVGKTKAEGIAELERMLEKNKINRIWNPADTVRKEKALEYLKSGGEVRNYKSTGRMYTVDIPDDAAAKMLDWDAPLSQQPKHIQDLAKSLGVGEDYLNSRTGQWLYESEAALKGKKSATAMLKANGIPGIRYLDAGSRSAGNGTRNVVVFDDKLVKVLEKE